MSVREAAGRDPAVERALGGRAAAAERPRRWLRGLRRFAAHQPLAVVGALIIAAFLVGAIFAPVLAPFSYAKNDLAQRLRPPSSLHKFGTDAIGRDVLSRLIYGARITMFVDAAAVALATLVATSLGILSAYYRGRLDFGLQRLVDSWMAFPPLVLTLSILLAVGRSSAALIITLGLLVGIPGVRIARASALGIVRSEYVTAVRAVGAGDLRIMARHVLPNIVPLMIIFATVNLGNVIIIEAGLSFLGYGIPPPFPSWGDMLGPSSLQYFYVQPWLTVWPGAAIALSVLGFNLLGDGLRDALDPRLRG